MRPIEKISDSAHVAHDAAEASARWLYSMSRHGVIAAERTANRTRNRVGFQQAISMLASSILIGLGVSLFVHARLGVPAYDVMLTALRDRLGVSLGQAGWIFTSFLFLMAALLGQRPRPTSIIFILANGLAIDMFVNLIRDPNLMAVRLLFVVLGTAAIALAVALVLHAGLTGGSMELLLRAAEERGIDQYRVRRALEAAIVIGGVSLGGDLGPATIIYVLTMAPMLRAGKQALADHRSGRAERLEENCSSSIA